MLRPPSPQIRRLTQTSLTTAADALAVVLEPWGAPGAPAGRGGRCSSIAAIGDEMLLMCLVRPWSMTMHFATQFHVHKESN